MNPKTYFHTGIASILAGILILYMYPKDYLWTVWFCVIGLILVVGPKITRK